MKKLSKGGLLEKLNYWGMNINKLGEEDDKQALKQIREIVESFDYTIEDRKKEIQQIFDYFYDADHNLKEVDVLIGLFEEIKKLIKKSCQV